MSKDTDSFCMLKDSHPTGQYDFRFSDNDFFEIHSVNCNVCQQFQISIHATWESRKEKEILESEGKRIFLWQAQNKVTRSFNAQVIYTIVMIVQINLYWLLQLI